MEQAFTFHVEAFEGPLDLLLHLVAKNKMDLADIEIVSLIDQYVAIVNGLPAYEMESASAFIEMAARLVQMKSFFLLPKSEEAERMKQELTGQLIEYSLCKAVAAHMGAMAEQVYAVVRAPAALEGEAEYALRHDPSLLVQAYDAVRGRGKAKAPPRPEQFEPLTQAPVVSVASRIIHVLRGLMTGRVGKLRELFSPWDTRSQSVATFLALLELLHAGRVSVGADGALTLHTHKARRGGARKGDGP